MDILKELEKRTRKAPLRGAVDPVNGLFYARLFHAFGPGTWYIAQYDPKRRLAMGYVTGLAADEWGYIEVDQLAAMQFAGVPRIELDLHFRPKAISQACPDAV